MDFLPIFLDVGKKTCLLVGGGEVALRKARLLARAGASLLLVAETLHPDLEAMLAESPHRYRPGRFDIADLEDVCLVVAATDSQEINREISCLARDRNIPVNVVDQPELCSLIFPAVIDRSPLLVAVSSGGNSPVLVRKVKEQIETQLPAASGQLARLLGSYRLRVKQVITSFDGRLRFWETILDSRVPELVYSGRAREAAELIEMHLEQPGAPLLTGEVYLVGAGPGDPDLLTLKALRLMLKADVVLYDRLVSRAVLEKVRPDAERIHVGKERGSDHASQSRINKMLVDLAGQGKRVLRLKGGDPFIFGRGGEEVASLIDHGIPFQIVPGITAASGCASYAGIPLTHRDFAHSVVFLTGHFKTVDEEPDWKWLCHPGQTLVFYMGLANLSAICERLVSHGMQPDKPAALIQKGTTPEHRVVTGTLESLPGQVEAAGIRAPTIVIVGDVVKLREKLDWYRPSASDLEEGS